MEAGGLNLRENVAVRKGEAAQDEEMLWHLDFLCISTICTFCAGSSSEGAKEKESPNAHRKGMDTANFMKLSEKCAQVMID